MKRQTAMALAAVFAMSVAGTALAAPANPFVDVPAKHWSYDAVTKLAQAGVVSGYGDDTYKGDRTMTRYEMATIIAKAMANSEKADAETQKTIDALAAEYGAELNNLGVRVDNLEKKIGNVKFSGVIRARYDHNELKDGAKSTDMTQKMRARLKVNAQINEDWAFTGRFVNIEDIRESGIGDDNDTKMDHLYLTGKAGVFDVTAGRFDATPAYGVALDDTVEGAMVSFGNKLRVDLFAGNQEYAPTSDKDDIYIANLGYALSDKLNAKGAYFHIDSHADTGEKVKLYEVGLDYQFNPNVNLSGVYLKSDADTQDKGFFTQLSYKGSDVENAGSFGIWANYRDLEKTTVLSSTLDIGTIDNEGGKGYEIGFDYVLKKNILWTTTYTDLEGTINKNNKGEYFRSQLEFFF
ncbi:S-layer homology domain-containing protein [Sporomusa sphaeroides]|uniref:S-layer homology domain-containing protein n=1 Tax=Sporomusa sphaeroides TaxID=47679 RepID=UPI003DA13D6D